ncbi:hypothetical protein GCM10010347_04270 [Streptomyces cirratus]|uniref:Secreted protein n=1 Tax=Streptomyces cirratus TaxID=68187 RepID=A0ABQ3EP67_9ACTN|nr:hypothetical protein [Streptomyces cirratus]GHB38098.1 hypothetical protein GCM10010347_04270 [Streptomyces cirratus]
MGGRKHTELGGHTGPPPRRAAPSAALTALAAALALGVLLWGTAFPCAGGVRSHVSPTAVAAAGAHEPARGGAYDPARGQTHGPAHAGCVAPHELPGCSPRSDTPPAVLPVPPSALAAVGAGAVVAVRPAHAGPVRAPGALARAPDLHALQVLRT